MLSSEENAGIFYFLGGMIVIVMTAVGLSLVMDQKFKFSSDSSEIRREIAASTSELAELGARHEHLTASLTEQESRLGTAKTSRGGMQEKLTMMRQRKSELAKSSGELRTSIAALEAKFLKYRADYRSATWAKAVGQEVGVLATRGGREYRQVTIAKVTDVGLEIRHEHGIARIQAPDLTPDWQERFQWDDEERRTRLKEESDHIAFIPANSGGDSPNMRDEVETTQVDPVGEAVDQENLNQLRLRVSNWKARISQLQSEQSIAASNASYSGQTSVPGSLETWKAKAARMTRELSRARVELSLAKTKLAAVSPGDPLLRSQSGDSP